MKLASQLAGALDALTLEEIDEQILIVKLNRPEVSNAISTAMGEEIIRVFGALEANPALYRCVILTGAGERAFCGGADLKQREGMTDEQFGVQHYLFERMNRAITYCPVPIICAANGSAVAGGLELLLACDFAYATANAVFGFTEVKRGIMPGGGGTQQLPRTIGVRRAKELILRGAKFTAQEALAWGVVNRLCEPGRVLADAIDAARDICTSAPLSVAQAKKAIDLGMQGDLRTGLYLEIEAYNRLIPTEDRLEGISAYNEKRSPRFKGR
ncbi:enoyl-CoA hydratase/isomerase family protein [Caballeronia novacaledonica]|uniref:Enoyl-CoA hydratase/isomerase family protein n=1 Tax=Caballeronia novacaledonica TaxID=1544861 RepID=A0ACB5QNF9_9BURK|nr:enoyl-CoA hydratase-related protein [Caballeronia novacaledonica]KAK48024.1 enoyl-CoA hydratase [Caballeronia jiangsuensis]GJH08051.1 enoyl-CoA hydratase/isomerase family protein [Caballeronia novacaledonica]GJH16471.1 enoyl-CoA hydratase/isomerase family protein [Caballeronia novacaledonica]